MDQVIINTKFFHFSCFLKVHRECFRIQSDNIAKTELPKYDQTTHQAHQYFLNPTFENLGSSVPPLFTITSALQLIAKTEKALIKTIEASIDRSSKDQQGYIEDRYQNQIKTAQSLSQKINKLDTKAFLTTMDIISRLPSQLAI